MPEGQVINNVENDPAFSLLDSSTIVSIMVFLGMTIVYFTNGNIELAINEMTSKVDGPPLFNNDTCGYDDDWDPLEEKNYFFLPGEKDDQGVEFEKMDKIWLIFMRSFGCILGAGVSSIISFSMGGKMMFCIVVSGCTILKSLIPPYSNNAGNIIILYTIASILEGGLLPTLIVLLENWSTRTNRPILGAIMFSGYIMGSLLHEFFGESFIRNMRLWKYTIFTFGVFVAPWIYIWLVTVYSDYRSDPMIREEEKRALDRTHESYNPNNTGITNILIKKILMEKDVMLLMLVDLGYTIMFDVVMESSPVYMREILHLSLKEKKILKEIGWVLMFITVLASSIVSSKLVRIGIESHIKDKIVISICAIGSGILLFLMGFVMCLKPAVYILYCVLNIILGIALVLIKLVPIYINAEYSSFITFLAIIWSTVFRDLSTYLIIPLINDKGTLMEWRVIFFLTSLVFTFLSAPFVCYISGVPVNFDV